LTLILFSDITIYDKVNLDCLVLGECTAEKVPTHIQQLLQFYDPVETQPCEVIWLLVYICAIENGFITQEDYKTMSLELELPAYTVNIYHSKNVLKLTRKRPAYVKNADHSLFTMKLMLWSNLEPAQDESDLKVILSAFVSGDWMVMTLSPEKTDSQMSGCSTVISISRYFISLFDSKQPIYKRFRKINELAKTLAHELFVPMRAQQNTILNKFPDAFLNRLPAEVYAYILTFMQWRDKLHLSQVWKYRKPSS